MKCINCNEEAQYIYLGSSFCGEHFNEHVERVKAMDQNKPIERVSLHKVCPKCLAGAAFTKTNCVSCGSQLVEWDLACVCGAKIEPWFSYSFFGRKSVPLDKYCKQCGHDITKLAKEKVKEIRSKYSPKNT